MQPTHIANPVRVTARRIASIEQRDYGNLRDLIFEDGSTQTIEKEMVARYEPVPGDYLVTQEDGYEYINPKDVFERKYHALDLGCGEGTTGDQSIEQAIQAKGLTAPRVKPEDITANIVDTEIVTHISKSGQVLRWAVLTTQSGFAVTGKPSASVSAENDDETIGRQVAYDNARDNLWELMGYALKQRLHEAAIKPAASFQQRVIDEKAELDGKLQKLKAFIGGQAFHGLGLSEQGMLIVQCSAMTAYSDTLADRIAAFKQAAQAAQ